MNFLCLCVFLGVTLADDVPYGYEPHEGSQQEVCPQIQCPGDADIQDGCRKPEFEIGSDGITKCRMCDSNFCGDPMEVCPAIECPDMPEPGCSKPQFVIGLDEVTMCPVCPKDICQNA